MPNIYEISSSPAMFFHIYIYVENGINRPHNARVYNTASSCVVQTSLTIATFIGLFFMFVLFLKHYLMMHLMEFSLSSCTTKELPTLSINSLLCFIFSHTIVNKCSNSMQKLLNDNE